MYHGRGVVTMFSEYEYNYWLVPKVSGHYIILCLAAKKFLYPGHASQQEQQRHSPIDHVISSQNVKQSGEWTVREFSVW